MKVAVACGGTGGHIFPGLATADVLRERGHDVTLWLAGKDVEAPAVRNWTGRIITVPSEGLPSGFSLRTLRAVWRILMAIRACLRVMRREKPDVLLAMGSYASVGPVAAALFGRIPVVLHEANVLPGRAITLFAGRASAVAASFEESRFYLKRKDLVITGMPIRKELEMAAGRSRAAGVDRNLFTVLVMGGSRGAHKLNDVASAALAQLHKLGHKIQIIHLTGVADEEAVRKVYVDAGVPARVHAFTDDMTAIYAATDLAICRSGAATCGELAVFAVPALLVPYPFAARDHQMANARAVEKDGAADVVPERDLGVPWLVDYVAGCISSSGRLARMSAAARARAPRSAASNLADLVVQTGKRGDGGHS